jgi:[ribosomal protein S5]-alanine N-acetyltransferase
MPFPLQTRRLCIRPLTSADGDAVLAVFAAPQVMRFWNSDPPADLAEAGEWAEYLEDMQRRLGYSQWHVSERAGGRLVGIAGLQPLDGGPDVELTYALEPSSWGRGLATEASAAALDYAFDEAGLERVIGIAKEENGASVRVLRKLGMTSRGVARYWGKEWARFEVTAKGWLRELRASTPPLVTDRLLLRPCVADDLEALCGVFGDPQVMRFVGAGRAPLGRSEVLASQDRVAAHWEEHGFGPLTVVDRASGRVLGEAGLQLLEEGPDVELTYTLARAAWGRGYATEAAQAVLRWGFCGVRLPRIVAVAWPDNAASLRVMEKIGMAGVGERECYGARLAEYAVTFGRWRLGAGAPAPSP